MFADETRTPTKASAARAGTPVVLWAIAICAGGITLLSRVVEPVMAVRRAAAGLTSAWPAPLDHLGHVVLKQIFFSPGFYCLMACLLLLEHYYPANDRQPVFSVHLLQDFLWHVAQMGGMLWLAGLYSTWLSDLLTPHLQWAQLTPLQGAPAPVTVICAILAADFLEWFHHWVRHKVPWFWAFHEVHHSQRRMNPMTDSRYHIVEYFIASSVTMVPLIIVAPSGGLAAWWLVLRSWHSRFYHSNVDFGMGWLRFLFVTPHSHHLHHSRDPKYYDCNFGTVLCIWDRLFGTHREGANGLSPTGIPAAFPEEQSVQGVLSGATLWQQTLHPFRRIRMGVRR